MKIPPLVKTLELLTKFNIITNMITNYYTIFINTAERLLSDNDLVFLLKITANFKFFKNSLNENCVEAPRE
jgi:hypothetical protein